MPACRAWERKAVTELPLIVSESGHTGQHLCLLSSTSGCPKET